MPRSQKKRKAWWEAILQLSLLGLAILALAGFSVFVLYAKDLPRPERISEVSFAKATQVYDRNGILLYEIEGKEKRVPAELADVPPHLIQAILATEDADFYDHFGLDFSGTVRAVLENIKSTSASQGGSTITQQLSRSMFLSREKTLSRKVRELVITLELERRYEKDEILEFYLNQVPYGSNVYGVGAASQFYFGKKVGDVTLEEAATLAAMIQAPSRYSPAGPNRDLLLARKNYVLDRMAETGSLSREEAGEAKERQLEFADTARSIRAPHFVLGVMDELFARYGEEFLRTNGLRIYTTLDYELQQAAEEAVGTGAARNAAFNAHNAALVALNPETGEILALVGSKDWYAPNSFPEGCSSGTTCLFDPKLNAATHFPPGRQPGSAFKPFVYATAFANGADPETAVMDEETNFGVWGGEEYIPQNYDGKFHGEVTLRQALAQSLNIPAVKVLLDMAGIAESVQTARDMGISTLRDSSSYGPALVLGAGEVTLLEMTSAYGVFAAEGKRVPPFGILRVEDDQGNVIEERARTPITVLDPEIARTMTDVLSDNEARQPVFSPNSSLNIPGVAAKTGTTQGYRDAWTIGFTPRTQERPAFAAGVWVGNNNNEPMQVAPGATVAAPLWRNFMNNALPSL